MGIHEGLKIPWSLRPCGFKSHLCYCLVKNQIIYTNKSIGKLKMSMEVLLYWITRLDAIHIMIIAGIIITAVIGIASGLISLCDGCEKGEVCRKKANHVFKRTIPFFFFSL